MLTTLPLRPGEDDAWNFGLMVAAGLGNIGTTQVARLGLPLTLLTFVVLMPADYLWWWALGLFVR